MDEFCEEAALSREISGGGGQGTSGPPLKILTAGAPDAFTHLQRRILALWDKVLDESGEPRPPAGVTDDHAQLIVPADTTAFLGTTRGWMGAPAA